MASKLKQVIAVFAALGGIIALGAMNTPSAPEKTTEQLLYETYLADGIPPAKARQFAATASGHGDASFEERYQRAQNEKRDQQRALYCAGRPENC